MKRKFTLLIAALALLTMIVQPRRAWGQTRGEITWTASAQGYENQEVITSVTFDTNVSATFDKGTNSNAPKYYTTGSAIRCYGGNFFTVTATEGNLTEIDLTFASGEGSNAITTDNGTYNNGTWTGSATSVTFTISGSSGHRRIAGFHITYSSGGSSLTDSDLALTGAPIALEFDLYNNSTAQVINYTTSRTGEVTINGGTGYVTTEIDQVNKTITVTPVAVTNGTKVITVNQAADDNYTSGSKTFTVNITDSTPFAGGDVTFTAGTDMGTTTSNNSPDEMTKSGVTIYSTDAAFATAQYRLYQSSTTTISVESGTITSIVFNGQSTSYPVSRLSVNGDNGSYTVSNNVGTWTGNSNEVSFDASGQVRLSSIVVTIAAPTSNPYITAVNVDIDYYVTGGNITYTINNEPNPAGSLTAAIKDGTTPTIANFSLGSITGEAVPFTCGANTESTAHTAEVTLTYTYNTNETVTKDVTITQAAAPIVYTSIPALFAAATTTETNVLVTFNNWVVSGVSTNGKNIFVTDNNGNGFVIYYNSDMSSIYAAGKILSGTAVSCTLKKYNGFAELLNVDESDLTITTEGTVTVAEVAMADLAGVNTGALLHYNDLTCSVNNNKYYLSDGTTTLQVYTSLYDFGSLENGKSYHITGVYQQYNSTKEILPRSAADVVKAADMSATVFSGLTAFSYVVNNGPSVAQTVVIYCYDLGTNVLTATAPSNFEVSLTGNDNDYHTSVEMTPDEGDVNETLYIRLEAGLDAGDYDGNLTFTANNLTTVEQALEGTVYATPLYTITLNQNTGGTISADKLTAEAGETVTLSYDLDDCYTFGGWTVLDGSAEPVEVTYNQFTMPDSDVEVDASFTQKTFVVTYSFNGEDIWSTSSISCGNTTDLLDEDDLETLEVVIPSGFYFQGWSEAQGSTTLVSSPYTPTSNITLYAVLTYGETETYYARVTSDLGIDWSGDYLIAYSDEIFADGRVGGKDDTGAIGKAGVQVDLSSYISGNNIPATNGDTYKVTLEEISEGSNTYVLRTQDGRYNYQTSNSNGLACSTNKETAASYPITITFTSENDIKLCLGGAAAGAVFRYNTGSGGLFRYYRDGGQSAVYLYKRTVSEAPNFNEVTVYNDPLVPEPVLNDPIPETTCVIVGEGITLTFNGDNNGTAANLVVQDGGQLIHTSPVEATIQKNITAASSWKSKGVDGWHFIASPVDELSTSVVASDHYDLYKYDEASAYWIYDHGSSAATPFETLERGIGYLYASKDPTTLDFAGSMEATNATVQKDLSWACSTYPELKGFNLMGNPFTRNLTTGDMKINTTAVTSYYGINAATNDIITYNIAVDPIKPGQGFMVQATAASQKLIFNPTSKESDGIYEGYISIKAGNDNSMDKAFIQIGNGNTLRKMTLSDNTMVYVMNGDEDYAAARVEELAGSMPVHFKAIEAGTQTITIEAKDIEAYSMKLIDNFTNEVIDLLLEPTYTFEAEVDDDEARFVLVFDFNNYTNVEESFENSHFAYQFGDELILNGNGTLQVFDIMGRFVMSREINGSERISTTALNTGVYVLRLNDNIQKIVVR